MTNKKKCFIYTDHAFTFSMRTLDLSDNGFMLRAFTPFGQPARVANKMAEEGKKS